MYSLFPVWWLIVAATKDRTALYQSNGLWFSGWHLWDNLQQVFTYQDGIFLRWTANSVPVRRCRLARRHADRPRNRLRTGPLRLPGP
ncbi:hypothetical protein SPURM210S_01869 [Streptomyces purpurascens]